MPSLSWFELSAYVDIQWYPYIIHIFAWNCMSTYVFTNVETSYGPSVTAHFWPILADAPVSPFGPLATHPARTLGRNSCEKKNAYSNACLNILNGKSIHYLKNKDIIGYLWIFILTRRFTLTALTANLLLPESKNPPRSHHLHLNLPLCLCSSSCRKFSSIVLSENPGKTSNSAWLKFKSSRLSLSLLKLPFGGTVYPVG